jgi:hypothetical protein
MRNRFVILVVMSLQAGVVVAATLTRYANPACHFELSFPVGYYFQTTFSGVCPNEFFLIKGDRVELRGLLEPINSKNIKTGMESTNFHTAITTRMMNRCYTELPGCAGKCLEMNLIEESFSTNGQKNYRIRYQIPQNPEMESQFGSMSSDLQKACINGHKSPDSYFVQINGPDGKAEKILEITDFKAPEIAREIACSVKSKNIIPLSDSEIAQNSSAKVENQLSSPSAGKARTLLGKMKAVSKEIQGSSKNSIKAAKWLELQHLAQEIARAEEADPTAVNARRCSTYQSYQKLNFHHPGEEPNCADDVLTLASQLGISFHFYDPAATFEVGNEGYKAYLQYWPDGPDADEAEYQSKFNTRLYPSTLGEIQNLIKEMNEFILKFPKSRFKKDVQDQIKSWQEQYNSGQVPDYQD